jgi:hypothetical protein
METVWLKGCNDVVIVNIAVSLDSFHRTIFCNEATVFREVVQKKMTFAFAGRVRSVEAQQPPEPQWFHFKIPNDGWGPEKQPYWAAEINLLQKTLWN